MTPTTEGKIMDTTPEGPNVWQAARQAYMDTHPEPAYLDFTCPRCRAAVGVPCTLRKAQATGSTGFHAPRMDKRFTALHKWQHAAVHAADAAADAARREARYPMAPPDGGRLMAAIIKIGPPLTVWDTPRYRDVNAARYPDHLAIRYRRGVTDGARFYNAVVFEVVKDPHRAVPMCDEWFVIPRGSLPEILRRLGTTRGVIVRELCTTDPTKES